MRPAAANWAAALVTLLVGVVGVAAPVARVDASADSSAGSSSARPGRVLDAQRIAAPDGARGWRVVYASRDQAGDDVAVTGVVFAPTGAAPARGRPVVAWAHGTTGIADGCGPSAYPGVAATIPWLAELLDAGYVVAATDYEGLGGPGVHPYLVGPSEARAVLDSIRAARELPTGAGRRAAVYGHSQGGHAALSAGELARDYAPELRVRGVAAGAPVVSPAAFVDHVARRPAWLGFVVLLVLGYQAAYPELASVPLLTADGAALARVAEEGCASAVLTASASRELPDVLASDARAALDVRLRENAVGRRRSAAPVLLWQGADDALTVPDEAAAYVRRACRRGTVVDHRVYEGADHATVLEAARDDVLAFLAKVLEGGGARDGVRDGCEDRRRR